MQACSCYAGRLISCQSLQEIDLSSVLTALRPVSFKRLALGERISLSLLRRCYRSLSCSYFHFHVSMDLRYTLHCDGEPSRVPVRRGACLTHPAKQISVSVLCQGSSAGWAFPLGKACSSRWTLFICHSRCSAELGDCQRVRAWHGLLREIASSYIRAMDGCYKYNWYLPCLRANMNRAVLQLTRSSKHSTYLAQSKTHLSALSHEASLGVIESGKRYRLPPSGPSKPAMVANKLGACAI